MVWKSKGVHRARVAVSALRRRNQRRGIVRLVLEIPIEEKHCVRPIQHQIEPRANGAPSQVARMASTRRRPRVHDPTCHGGPVVDDNHVIDVRPDLPDDVADGVCFIEGGDKRHDAHPI